MRLTKYQYKRLQADIGGLTTLYAIIKAEKNKEKEPNPRVRFRFLLAEREGFAPLAARPGEQRLSAVQFAKFALRCFTLTQTARSRSRLHPRIPLNDAVLAEREGFEPPEAFASTVFKFYPASVACRLLVLFNSPNCRKISVLTALLSDNSGFLLCFSIVPRSLLLLIFNAFLTAFCRWFVDE